MSLDILKERFSGKPITSEYEEKLEDKEKVIQNLNEKTIILSDEVNRLKNEKNTLIQHLNEAKHFEDGVFSIKEKEYDENIYLKDTTIKVMREEVNSLHLKLDKKDERLSYKDDLINNSLNIIKEAKNKINYLNGKLKLSKNSKKELQLEIKKTYQDYIFKIDNLENNIKDRNDIINEQKHILKEDNKKIKKLTNKLENLKIKSNKDKEKINELNNELKESKTTLVLENNVFKQRLNEKEKNISKLETKIENLSEKVIGLSETARENSILEKKLQEAEKFQNIVKNKDYKINVTNNNNNLNTDNLICTLKEVSKEKQGPKPLTWKQWIEIPESNYLNELNHDIAKKIFNEINQQFLLEDKNQHDSHARRPGVSVGIALFEQLEKQELLGRFTLWSRDLGNTLFYDNEIDAPATSQNRAAQWYEVNVTRENHDYGEGVPVSGQEITYVQDVVGRFAASSYPDADSHYRGQEALREHYSGGTQRALEAPNSVLSSFSLYSAAPKKLLKVLDEDNIPYMLQHIGSYDSANDNGGLKTFNIAGLYGQTWDNLSETLDWRAAQSSKWLPAKQKRTYVSVLSIPSISSTGQVLEGFSKSPAVDAYTDSLVSIEDTGGISGNDDFGLMWQYDMNTSSDTYGKIKCVFNPEEVGSADRTIATTTNAIPLDTKVVIFTEVDRINGKIKLFVNDESGEVGDGTAINNNNTFLVEDIEDNFESSNEKMTQVQIGGASIKQPETRHYVFELYDKALEHNERKATYDYYKEFYKVT